MNTSAIVMLIVVLVIFLGGIGFCISRLKPSISETETTEDQSPD